MFGNCLLSLMPRRSVGYTISQQALIVHFSSLHLSLLQRHRQRPSTATHFSMTPYTLRLLLQLALLLLWYWTMVYSLWILSTVLVFRLPFLGPLLDMLDFINHQDL